MQPATSHFTAAPGWRGVVPVGLLVMLGLLLGGGAPATVRAAGKADSIYVSGREHVRLAAWAKAQNLEASWLVKDKSLQLTGRSSRIVLTINSREARVNGVTVWMLFPIVQRGGGVYLSRSDTLSTFGPLLAPGKSGRIKTICLDPGHGGRDPGNRSGTRYEKAHTLLLANEVKALLTRAGFKVVLTRATDAYIDLEDRPAIARNRGADLFVSLHFNGAESSRSLVKGAEVYSMTPAGAPSTNAQGEGAGAGSFAGNRNNDHNLLLAYCVQKSLLRSLYVEDRGVRRARFAVLRDATMPAVLIEAGFLSHPTEGVKIVSAEYRGQMAKAIVDGILAYKKMVEPAARR